MTDLTTKRPPVWANVLGYWMPGSAWRRGWAESRTIADHGELVARWLEGTYRYTPGRLSPPNLETAPLVPDLVTLNRGGVVTTGSQPGATGADQAGRWVKRAYVTAYGDAAVIARLARAAVAAGLWVTCDPYLGDAVQTMPAQPLPITFNLPDRTPRTGLFPAHGGWDWSGITWHSASREAWEDATQLAVVDPTPGRERLLWDTLTAALDADTASPDDEA